MAHKFTCDKCDGKCELIINAQDLEDKLPINCPSSDIESDWIEIKSKCIECEEINGKHNRLCKTGNMLDATAKSSKSDIKWFGSLG